MLNHTHDTIAQLGYVGISYADAIALRRISMTLHRWHELECGDSNAYRSECIVRGKKVGKAFEYDDAGQPYLEVHYHRGDGKTQYQRTGDRERGTLKRLAAIMARYPGFEAYVQGDPRGCALYILTPDQMASREPGWLEANYSQGIAVYK